MYISRNSTDFHTKKMLFSVQKIGSRSYNFLYLFLDLSTNQRLPVSLKLFWDTSQTTIFDLLWQIWRVKVENNLKIFSFLDVVYRPSNRPNVPFQSDAPEGSDTFRWQLWDKVKPHGTVIDWCTGREWPVNCITVFFRLMTIKHAIPKILSGRLIYYITRWRQEVS